MNTVERKTFNKEFWRFLWASILIGLSACLGNVVDAMIVGNLIDEDSVSAIFRFENGLPGSGSWCFVAHESAREDSIQLSGDQGSLRFSVFDYAPIVLHTSEGTEHITVPNPPYVQQPLIQCVIEHLQGISICDCTSVSATPVNWAMDRILGKF